MLVGFLATPGPQPPVERLLLTGVEEQYRTGAAVAAGGGIILAAPAYLIGFLRRQKYWKLASLFILGVGLIIAVKDLIDASTI